MTGIRSTNDTDEAQGRRMAGLQFRKTNSVTARFASNQLTERIVNGFGIRCVRAKI